MAINAHVHAGIRHIFFRDKLFAILVSIMPIWVL